MFEAVDSAYAPEGWMFAAGDGLGAMMLLLPDTETLQAEVEAAVANGIAALFPDGGEPYQRMWSWIAARPRPPPSPALAVQRGLPGHDFARPTAGARIGGAFVAHQASSPPPCPGSWPPRHR